jgi:hypothetical protein
MFSTVVVLGFFFASGMGINFPDPESLPRLFGIVAPPNDDDDDDDDGDGGDGDGDGDGDGHLIRPISA